MLLRGDTPAPLLRTFSSRSVRNLGSLSPEPVWRTARCVTPPGPAFLSFSDSIRSAPHVEETCIDCPSAACCQTPRLRVIPATRSAALRIREPDLPLQSPSSLIASAASRWSGPKRLRSANPAMPQLRLPCRPPTRFRVPWAPVSRPAPLWPSCPGNSFCAFLSPAAPTVRLPYRDMLALTGVHIPPPPSPFIRRSSRSGFM
ncbi:hypothetical protein LMG24235_06599 [Paraburkholderia sabiae]|nr:hypothetical protein LMG24235_06599 [Paraburkholderia sabiae]